MNTLAHLKDENPTSFGLDQVYPVVPPEAVMYGGVAAVLVAAYDHEENGESRRVSAGVVLTEPIVQELELPYVRRSATAPTAIVRGVVQNQLLYEEVNPVLYSGGRIEPKRYATNRVSKNLRALQGEAAGAVLGHLGLEQPKPKGLRWLKQRFGSAPKKTDAPTR